MAEAERSTGSYVVLDTMPLIDIMNQERNYNRKRNAEKAAKRATSAAAIDEQFGKLKNTAWDRDQQYISGLIKETEDWMVDKYSKYGATSISENPELKREFQQRLGNIKRQNEASHAQISMGNEMLKKSSGNLDNLDEKSLGEYNAWLELPSEERLRTPMPIIRDREMEFSEIMERDFKTEISNLVVPTGYSGKPDEEGRYVNYDGKTVNKEGLDKMVSTLSKNPNAQAYKLALKEVNQEINTDLVPPTILQNGVEVENPDYTSAIEQRVEAKIRESIESLLPPTYMKSKAAHVPGSGDKDDQPEVEYTTDDETDFTVETTPGGISESKIYEDVYRDKSGKEYGKLKIKMYDYGGKLYKKENLPKGLTIDDDDVYGVPIGTVVDQEGSTRKDGTKGLTPIRETKERKAEYKATVRKPGKSNTVIVTETYSDDEKTVSKTNEKSVKGTFRGEKGVKAVKKDGKLYYQGDKEYNDKDAKVIKIATVETKDGKLVKIPGEKARKVFVEEYKEIDQKRKSKTGEQLSGDSKEPNKYGI